MLLHPVRLFFALSAIGLVSAHLDHVDLTEREIDELHADARACSDRIDNWTEERRAKRTLERRGGIYPRQYTNGFSTATLAASRPHYTTFRNTTCVAAPDVTEGPYYILNEFVRQDLRENHRGIALELDIGVMDTSTCKPMPGVYVELWGANATGRYTGFASYADSGSAFPPPNPRMTDPDHGLRGGYPTNSNGLVGITTIYPGFYTGRTIHLHVLIHTTWKAGENGTLVSNSQNVRHIGQLYFEENWSDQVMRTTEYARNTFQRTRNAGDTLFRQGNTGGFSAIIGLEQAGSRMEDGLYGYITIGVNSKSAARRLTSQNYAGTFRPAGPIPTPPPRPFPSEAPLPPTSSTAAPPPPPPPPPSSSAPVSSAPVAPPGTVPRFGQCGGMGWTGPTQCVSGSVCQVLSDFYSQCM